MFCNITINYLRRPISMKTVQLSMLHGTDIAYICSETRKINSVHTNLQMNTHKYWYNDFRTKFVKHKIRR